ncbi:phosphatase PAP2 family protein [Galbibacter sp. BG1]|uniref:phosphatase PAP2 family protein n=1 Tax=Galbibacter sp. BG1 TaxID=1170699 RepID=UPI0015BE75BB|nr:phosphatase PAP2 family protein [Galbibacter sp. BG1]QLE00227.1 phosphatase PAP2 family protein [Galbibacter sp. BG1]
MLKKLIDYDRDLLIFLNNLGVENYDKFWGTITQPITWIPLYILAIYLIYRAYRSKGFLKVLLLAISTLLVTSGFTHLVKVWVGRIRPSGNEDYIDLLRVLLEPTSFSFFSGHAATSFAMTTFFVLVLRHKYKWITIFYVWPLLFSFSRIYVGVHYPSDILIGSLVGTLMAYAFYQIHKRWVLNYPAHRETIPNRQ